jgi:hypothetical protein
VETCGQAPNSIQILKLLVGAHVDTYVSWLCLDICALFPQPALAISSGARETSRILWHLRHDGGSETALASHHLGASYIMNQQTLHFLFSSDISIMVKRTDGICRGVITFLEIYFSMLFLFQVLNLTLILEACGNVSVFHAIPALLHRVCPQQGFTRWMQARWMQVSCHVIFASLGCGKHVEIRQYYSLSIVAGLCNQEREEDRKRTLQR